MSSGRAPGPLARLSDAELLLLVACVLLTVGCGLVGGVQAAGVALIAWGAGVGVVAAVGVGLELARGIQARRAARSEREEAD